MFRVGSIDWGLFLGERGKSEVVFLGEATYHSKFSGYAHYPSLIIKLRQRLGSLHNAQQATG